MISNLKCMVSKFEIIFNARLLNKIKYTYLTNSTMHQTNACITASFCYTNAHVCTFLLQNGVLWDMGQVHA